MNFYNIAMIAIAFAWTVPSAEAVIIYDNGAVVDTAETSDSDSPHFVADDFILAAGANTITDVHWTGGYFNGNTPQADNFTIQIIADAGGAPTTSGFGLLHSINIGASATRTDTGIDLFGSDLYSYAVDLAPSLALGVTLAPGTNYWLSIVNDTGTDLDDNWAWGMQSGGGNSVRRFFGGNTPWDVIGNAADFQLTATSVPEPATMTLLGIGLAGLGWSRRRSGSGYRAFLARG